MTEKDNQYPPLASYSESSDPAYQDHAAVELYKEAKGGKLVGALANLNQALVSQSGKLEEFHNTPYSESNALLISTTMGAIEKVQVQIERWHYLIYPNQRPEIRLHNAEE